VERGPSGGPVQAG